MHNDFHSSLAYHFSCFIDDGVLPWNVLYCTSEINFCASAFFIDHKKIFISSQTAHIISFYWNQFFQTSALGACPSANNLQAPDILITTTEEVSRYERPRSPSEQNVSILISPSYFDLLESFLEVIMQIWNIIKFESFSIQHFLMLENAVGMQ